MTFKNCSKGEPCFICLDTKKSFLSCVEDYEYGIKNNSILVTCPKCGLVSQNPKVSRNFLENLYPKNYQAHLVNAKKSGSYNRLKKIIYNKTVKQISDVVPRGGSVLEVGCGTGSMLSLLAIKRPDLRIVGVDLFEPSGALNGDFEFFKGQLEEVVFNSSTFDVVYHSNLIEHVTDPLKFVEESRRVLKKDGFFIGVTPNHKSFDRFIFRKFWAGYHYPRHTFIFNDQNLSLLLKNKGFSEVTFRGSYSFWALSILNILRPGHGNDPRGMLFVLFTLLTMPLDIVLNLFYPHGSLTFKAKR